MANSPEQPDSKQSKKRRSSKPIELVHVSVRPVAQQNDSSGKRSRAAQEENSILIGRARDRSTQPPNARTSSSSSPSPDRPASSARESRPVPAEVLARYIQVGNKYHFENGELAWTDRGDKLSTRLHNSQIIADLIATAQGRGAESIRLKGSTQFKKEAWQQAKLAGLEVRGYAPSEVERVMIVRLLAQRRARADAPETGAVEETQRSSTSGAASEQATRDAVKVGERVMTGRLIDHGPANWKFDQRENMSYYVKVATAEGERTIWGKDLERAIEHSLSRAKRGDEIGLNRIDSKRATASRPVYDESGRLVEQVPVPSRRTQWVLERTDFLEQRANLAQIVRDASVAPGTALADHPELAGTYQELHLASVGAPQLYPHTVDQQRFLNRTRASLAQEIQLGQPLPVQRPRTRTAEAARRDPRVAERAQEHVLS